MGPARMGGMIPVGVPGELLDVPDRTDGVRKAVSPGRAKGGIAGLLRQGRGRQGAGAVSSGAGRPWRE